MNRRRALISTLAAALLLALAGCSAGGSSSGAEPAAPDQGGATSSTVVAEDREIIRNAFLSVRVEDVRASSTAVAEIAVAAGGRVAGESVDSQGDSESASLTLRVPAAALDSTLNRIGALGTVTSLNVTSEDVTAQAVDLDARTTALRTSVARLTQLLAEARSTADLLAIEKELAARQAELDSLTAQRAALKDAVVLSTVTVSLWPASLAAGPAPPGFLSGLQTGWNALRTVAALAVTVAGFAIPFLLALLVIAVPVALLVMLVRRSRRS